MAKMSRLVSITSVSPPSTMVAVLPLQACGPTSVQRASLWASYISPIDTPKYNPFSYRKLSTISGSSLTVLRDTHFGEFGTASTLPDIFLETTVKVRPPSKFKDFAKAKADGKIILNPMLAYTASVNVGSGCWMSTVTGTPVSYSVQHVKTAQGFPAGPTGCPNYPYATTYDDVRVSSSVLRGGDLPTSYNYLVYSTPSLGAAVTADAALFFRSKVLDTLDSCVIDTSLVTAARAEASQGIIDLSTTLAEAPETVREIYALIQIALDRFVAVKRKLKKLRRGDFASILEYGNTVSQLWLQFRYGIMPNVYSIQDLLKYLNTEAAFYQTVRQGDRYSIDLPEIAGWTAAPIEVVHRCFVKNRFDLSMSKKDMYLKANAFGTAWEVIPLSFVMDWFLNIGDLLASLSAPSGSVQEASMYSFSYEGSVLYTHPDWIGPPIKVAIKYYRAETILPEDYIGLALQFNLNWKRWLDALALTWSFAKGNHKQLLRALR